MVIAAGSGLLDLSHVVLLRKLKIHQTMMILPYTFYVVRMHLGIVRVSVSADRLLAEFVTRRPHWRWPYLVDLLLPENDSFFTKWNSTGTKILVNSVDNSSKTHRIHPKQVSFDSIR